MDAWVEAEIKRQLQEISVGEAEELADGNGGEELGHTEGSQLIGHSQVSIVCGGRVKKYAHSQNFILQLSCQLGYQENEFSILIMIGVVFN